jgi:hypothetical protein
MAETPYQPPGTEKSRKSAAVRFTLRDLLFSIFLIAVGMTGLRILWLHGQGIPQLPGLVLALGSIGFITAGIGGPLTGHWGWSALAPILLYFFLGLLFSVI